MFSNKKTETESGNERVYSIESVDSVRTFDEHSCAFNMVVNGVKIYGMTYREGVKDGKPYEIVSFPSRKGNDGKYYSHAFFKITEDLKKVIIDKLMKAVES